MSAAMSSSPEHSRITALPLFVPKDIVEDTETACDVKRPVAIGLKMFSVSNIQDLKQTFEAQFALDFLWMTKPEETFLPRLGILNSDTDVIVLDRDKSESPQWLQSTESHLRSSESLSEHGSLHYMIMRKVKTELTCNLDFHWFPFDVQYLPIRVRALNTKLIATDGQALGVGSVPLRPYRFLFGVQQDFGERLNVDLTIVLTLIAFKLMVTEMVPKASYLSAAEWYLSCFGVATCMIAEHWGFAAAIEFGADEKWTREVDLYAHLYSFCIFVACNLVFAIYVARHLSTAGSDAARLKAVRRGGAVDRVFWGEFDQSRLFGSAKHPREKSKCLGDP
ncbi:hypothetical protein EMIHUDRAFT_241030 [Emiliania huxleyi CCMP1516]|uniref:Ion transport domain-containing protein n=2 Tax=Emiliania huxleyi TaxID=2903 RepID=A0A0D3JDJ4_EMIH1|nr:hypothetical protein EMIHUDRAFT_241030 [Emiliania huxleyi CCMP1516]EOD21579.1 hypothetical protein EMIHUDRAFT_241030 [Emiliania huxleyi CCMP1516]|eukprot:XP_005774008.1 hypothetical protein EMIHUDRAFT_241030 [Emiliania huxleyi CCMP1516]